MVAIVSTGIWTITINHVYYLANTSSVFMFMHMLTSHLILTKTMWVSDFYYSYFQDREIEAKQLSALPKATPLVNGAMIWLPAV